MRKLLTIFALLVVNVALAAPAPAPRAKAAAVAAAVAAPQAALSWTPPTANTDGSAITGSMTFNVYQGLQGSALAKVANVTGNSATITSGVTPGSTQCFAVSTVVGTTESAQSATVCASIAVSVAGAPTQVTVVIH